METKIEEYMEKIRQYSLRAKDLVSYLIGKGVRI